MLKGLIKLDYAVSRGTVSNIYIYIYIYIRRSKEGESTQFYISNVQM